MPSSHRSGSLKQSNKGHKSSVASKRALSRGQGAGKVNKKERTSYKHASSSSANSARANRTNESNMKRKLKVANLISSKRIGTTTSITTSTAGAPPKTIGVISLSEGRGGKDLYGKVTEEAIREYVLSLPSTTNTTPPSPTFIIPQLKGHLTLLTPNDFLPASASPTSDSNYVAAALEMTRVCDVVIFAFDGVAALLPPIDSSPDSSEEYPNLLSTQGERALIALKAQGLPTALGLLLLPPGTTTAQAVSKKNGGLTKGDRRKIDDLRKYVGRFLKGEMGDDVKVVEEDEDITAAVKAAPLSSPPSSPPTQLLRALVSAAPSPINFVGSSARNYMTAPATAASYDAASKTLNIVGYLRGAGALNVNGLVHVTNVGTFQMAQIQTQQNARLNTTATIPANPAKQESMARFAAADALDGEQNLVGFDGDENALDEFDDVDDEGNNEEAKVSRPAGWSDYQSAWLEDANEQDLDDIGEGDAFDNGELSDMFNKRGGVTDGDEVNVDMDMDDDGGISAAEREALANRRKNAEDEMIFPDEVQVNEGEVAAERFARYRSLKSFRQTHWDPKENLPEDYAQLYNFSNFKATAKAVRADQKDIVEEVTRRDNGDASADDAMEDADDAEFRALIGASVAPNKLTNLSLANVTPEQFAVLTSRPYLTLTTLMPHENKMSVLHFNISQTLKCETAIDNGEDAPVRSKDVLTIQVGFRSWQARPIFSENNLNCDKHKFERFLRPNSFMACSAYGPVTYGPTPVMIWREPRPGQSERQLVAMGSVMGADADRTIVKRVVVTGYPVRVHKRHATVKYMFYTPEDVNWFKPAALHTKHGLQGNIEESIGTHGAFKCLFNQPIKQHDTVCLALYKRVFPKYVSTEEEIVIL